MSEGLRGGHSLDVQGAIGKVSEVTEDRKIVAKAVYLMNQEGKTCYDLSPLNSGTSAKDLAVPIAKAIELGLDYFGAIHLNASNGNGHGCEVLYRTEAERIIAQRIVNNLASLGFSNRGVKYDERNLYEFRATPNLTNNIIEPFFVDNEKDVIVYRNVGPERIAKAIVEGILGRPIKVAYSGWYLIDGNWYYYDSSNNMVKNGWAKDSKGKWFYLGADGKMVKNYWVEYKNAWYYLGSDGEMTVNGWAKDSHGWCFLGSDGAWDNITRAEKVK